MRQTSSQLREWDNEKNVIQEFCLCSSNWNCSIFFVNFDFLREENLFLEKSLRVEFTLRSYPFPVDFYFHLQKYFFSKQHIKDRNSSWMNCFPIPIYIPSCIQFLCPKLTQTNIRQVPFVIFVWKTRPIRTNTQCASVSLKMEQLLFIIQINRKFSLVTTNM